MKTVAVASVASAASTVSQPTSSSQVTAVLGSTFPRTPKAARDSTIVGADRPLAGQRDEADQQEAQHDASHPGQLACRELTPKPSRNEP